MKRASSYKKSGVNVEKAELFIKKIRDKSSKERVKSFASLFDLKKILTDCKQPQLVSSCDGVGTKLIIAQDLKIHDTVGIDLVAMNVNDLICLGAKPLFFLDYIACGKLNVNTLVSVVKGIKQGLKESDCALTGGETAEMPDMYKKEEYDLAGFCVGVVDKTQVVDGKNIKAGDAIIGLESSGIHSNGYSLVRKALTKQEIKMRAKEILKPTRIYVKPILSLLSNSSIKKSKAVKGIAHITGGAFYNKATKILGPGLGMKICKNSWKIPKLFNYIQAKAKISEKEMFSVFNMGIGMMVVIDKRHAKAAQKIISKFNIKNYIIGEIIKSKKKIEIV